MDTSTTQLACSSHELRFENLFKMGRGYAFPCDAAGRVDLDTLSDLARANYLYARRSVGREFFAPVTCLRERGDRSPAPSGLSADRDVQQRTTGCA